MSPLEHIFANGKQRILLSEPIFLVILSTQLKIPPLLHIFGQPHKFKEIHRYFHATRNKLLDKIRKTKRDFFPLLFFFAEITCDAHRMPQYIWMLFYLDLCRHIYPMGNTCICPALTHFSYGKISATQLLSSCC